MYKKKLLMKYNYYYADNNRNLLRGYTTRHVDRRKIFYTGTEPLSFMIRKLLSSLLGHSIVPCICN